MDINLRLADIKDKGQIVGLLILALGYVLFVLSSFNYSNEPWFIYLIGGRIFAILLALITIILLFNKNVPKSIDSFYYTFCLGLQAFHGCLEGEKSVDFYSYTGIFFIISALSTNVSFKSWITRFFPIQFIFLITPLFFKDAVYFKSIAKFVDSFSLPVSGLVIGLVINWINTQKFEIYQQNLLLKEELAKEQERISKQLAHDIRSPLASLNMIIRDLNSIPEEYRLLIRNSVGRINDIANSLLNQSSTKNKLAEIILLSEVVDSIASEKRVQFRDKINTEILVEHKNSYGVFVNLNSIEFKRMLSNLINNSIESFSNYNGKLIIKTELNSNEVKIILEDNGCGIPAEVIRNLGVEGFSYNKEKNHGLGIYHAKKTIRDFRGSLNIESTVNKGTKLTIALPLENTPKWFCDKINLENIQEIYSLDDDNFIHQLWKNRFSNFNQIPLKSFTSISEFEDAFLKNDEVKLKHTLFLIDYEFIGQGNITGLDVINKLNICSNVILVTSHFEETDLINKCLLLNFKIVPKSLSSLVPIVKQISRQTEVSVLLDDDELVRQTWAYKAKKNNIELIMFSDAQEMMDSVDQFGEETNFYIDSELKGTKGEKIAEDLALKGFKNITLATGYPKENFLHLNFLKDVIGKQCPF